MLSMNKSIGACAPHHEISVSHTRQADLSVPLPRSYDKHLLSWTSKGGLDGEFADKGNVRRRNLFFMARRARTHTHDSIEPLSALFRPVWTENERVDYMSTDVHGRHLHGTGPFSGDFSVLLHAAGMPPTLY